MSESSQDNSLRLRSGLLSLPQELYDRIYNLVFTAPPKVRIYKPAISDFTRNALDRVSQRFPSEIVIIDEKIPHLLHVSRHSRKQFAQSYFGGKGATFIFYAPMRLWRMPFEQTHWRLIRDLRVGYAHDHVLVNWESRALRSEKAQDFPGKEVLERVKVQYHGVIEKFLEERTGVKGEGGWGPGWGV